MKIHEYQAKALFRQFGVDTPKSVLVRELTAVDSACTMLGGSVWVVKAQVHAGGRGKGGGVVVCHSVTAVKNACQKLIEPNDFTKDFILQFVDVCRRLVTSPDQFPLGEMQKLIDKYELEVDLSDCKKPPTLFKITSFKIRDLITGNGRTPAEGVEILEANQDFFPALTEKFLKLINIP